MKVLSVPVQVRGDPGTVLKLRCLFLKLRSLLEVPLLRMGQARSPALAATSRVYSSTLVAFSRRLLQASFSTFSTHPFPLQSTARITTAVSYRVAFFWCVLPQYMALLSLLAEHA